MTLFIEFVGDSSGQVVDYGGVELVAKVATDVSHVVVEDCTAQWYVVAKTLGHLAVIE
jgi:hypothetical protein